MMPESGVRPPSRRSDTTLSHAGSFGDRSHYGATQTDGRCVLGCPVAWLNQAGFLSVWLVWADVVPRG